jgi:hypothetical protein
MVIDILRHTPAWVWLLLAALLALGVSQLRTRRVSRRRLWVLPVVLCSLGVSATAMSFRPATPALAAWATALAAGVMLGRRLRPPADACWDTTGRTLLLPGSAGPLLLMIAIFTLRYASGVALALHPAWREAPHVALPLAALYGAIGGMLFGRTLGLLPGAAATIRTDVHDRHA